jgi:hypothetical protein
MPPPYQRRRRVGCICAVAIFTRASDLHCSLSVTHPRAYRVVEKLYVSAASFTKWEPGMPVALGDQLRRPRLK